MPGKALSLSSSIQSINGIGENRVVALGDVGIRTIGDLLNYFPRKHLDRTTITPTSNLKKGTHATIIGKIEVAGLRQNKRRKYFQAILSDGKGMITLTWFNGASYMNKSIKVGDRLAVSGNIDFFNGFQVVHPEFDKLKDNEDPINSGLVIPLYPITAKLKKTGLDSRGIRRIIKSSLDSLNEIPDYFSEKYRNDHGLINLDQACLLYTSDAADE